jgi:hypothetical protein
MPWLLRVQAETCRRELTKFVMKLLYIVALSSRVNSVSVKFVIRIFYFFCKQGCTDPRRLNCVLCHWIFVDPQYGPCFLSPFWRLEFLSLVLLDFWEVYILLCVSIYGVWIMVVVVTVWLTIDKLLHFIFPLFYHVVSSDTMHIWRSCIYLPVSAQECF